MFLKADASISRESEGEMVEERRKEESGLDVI